MVLKSIMLAGAALALLPPLAAGQAGDPLLNEFVINHAGSDVNEFIEVFGAPHTDYSAFAILEVEGDAGGSLGVVDGVFPVGATDAEGFWTTAFLNSAIENGTVTLLLVETFTGSAGDDLDADDDGMVDPTPPWNRLVDAVAVADGGSGDRVYSDAVLSPGFDDTPTMPGGASRFPNGVDTGTAGDWLRNDFDGDGLPGFPDAPPAATGEAINTPGTINRPGFTHPPPHPPHGLIINEVDADTPGSDTREFIELYDGGTGATPLDDLVMVFFNGTNDQSYRAIDLDGFATDADGFFVMGGSALIPPPHLILPASALQNGADAVALFAGDAEDFPNGTPATTDFLVDAVVYDSDDADDAGLLALLNPGQPQLNENSLRTREVVSIQRLPHGAGGARNTTTYRLFLPTPGSVNGGADLSLRKQILTTTRDGATRTTTFRVLLTNDGPAPATGIAVTTHLATEQTIAHAAASRGFFEPSSNQWTVGTLDVGDAATLSLTLTTATSGAPLLLTEVTTADQPDPDSVPGDGVGDDAAALALDRPPPDIDRFQADLRLAMTATPTVSRVGETVTWTLTLTNDGPATTVGVEVTAPLPDALLYGSATGDGTYNAESSRWRVGRLAKDATKTLTLTSTVARSGAIRYTAEVTRNNLPDPDSPPGNGNVREDDWAEATIQAQDAAAKASGETPLPIPTAVTLEPNYPNPFNPETQIPFSLPEAAHATVIVYDVLGRAVETLVDGPLAAGRHTARWRASAYPSGLYVVRLRANNEALTRYVTLLK